MGVLAYASPVNYYTHGSQLTAAHGHLAFFGAYAMVVMCMISYSMPVMNGRPQGNSVQAQKVERIGFWLMCIGMLGITFALTAAGIWQVALQRIPEAGKALSFMATQEVLKPFYIARLGFGLIFTAGVAAYFASFVVANKNGKQYPDANATLAE
ncbi:hypothetical protein GCM10025855_41980 [Shewanella glacialipiscicola]|uniref:Uncharacterized protein n=1 Tax=Shewanella glacialipiscicola TaxID=614069 RepID=A0ABQ6J0S6_9GAMM|nr:hypothetical protein GCM10025855_12460 [Shewanella glacialipiscicola]GMA84663.1 hypothetical protein GCM10025855_41980 [Shewanella glacialipiscicola]